MAIFSVDLADLDDLVTACALDEDCYFDKDAYVPYALGFLIVQGDSKCGNPQGPYILKGRNSPANLPF